MRSCRTSARRCGVSSSRGSARSRSTSRGTHQPSSTGCWRTPRRRVSSARCARRPATRSVGGVSAWLCDSLSRMTDRSGRTRRTARRPRRSGAIVGASGAARCSRVRRDARAPLRVGLACGPFSAFVGPAVGLDRRRDPDASRRIEIGGRVPVPSPTVARELPAGLSVTVDAIVFAVGRRLDSRPLQPPRRRLPALAAPTRSSSVPATSPTAA